MAKPKKKAVWAPIVEAAPFVPVSQIVRGLLSAWAALVESDPSFSWGDNNRTLI